MEPLILSGRGRTEEAAQCGWGVCCLLSLLSTFRLEVMCSKVPVAPGPACSPVQSSPCALISLLHPAPVAGDRDPGGLIHPDLTDLPDRGDESPPLPLSLLARGGVDNLSGLNG